MGAGSNGSDYLFRFGGCKNKLHVGRGFFNDLQKSIEALRGDHMSLIEDENLVAISSWSKDGSLSQIPGVINTVVTSGIDFNNV